MTRKPRTLAVGVPWEKPVPIGCSTYRTLERLVQLHSFCVGEAWPGLQIKGWAVLDIVLGISLQTTYSILSEETRHRRATRTPVCPSRYSVEL